MLRPVLLRRIHKDSKAEIFSKGLPHIFMRVYSPADQLASQHSSIPHTSLLGSQAELVLPVSPWG